jgi:hypothetical protein
MARLLRSLVRSREPSDKWWATWGEKHQREVGNKYADFGIIGVEGVQ